MVGSLRKYRRDAYLYLIAVIAQNEFQHIQTVEDLKARR